MVSDLTGMDIANASMLDEATAAAEAMMMSHRFKGSTRAMFSSSRKPAIRKRLKSSAPAPQRWAWKPSSAIMRHSSSAIKSSACWCNILTHSARFYSITSDFAEKVHAAGAMLTVATDLLALTLIKPPGEFGADIAVGSAQRFGVPLGYGGPHAGFFATRDEFKRQMPGRLVGVSKDARGRPAFRLALRPASNTSAARRPRATYAPRRRCWQSWRRIYACYHGPEGLRKIAKRVHRIAATFCRCSHGRRIRGGLWGVFRHCGCGM